VIVPDYQLSLAIGKEGQNARLAARLTGWRIDIRSDTAGDEPAGAAPGARPVASSRPGGGSGAPAGGSRRGRDGGGRAGGGSAGSAGGAGMAGTVPGAADAPAL
jgi:N utilization substance protein A